MLAQAQFWCMSSVTSAGCRTELNQLWPSGQILTFCKQSFMRTPSHLLIYMHLWFSVTELSSSDRSLGLQCLKYWYYLALWENTDHSCSETVISNPKQGIDIPSELFKKFQSPRPNLILTSPLKRLWFTRPRGRTISYYYTNRKICTTKQENIQDKNQDAQ